MCFFLTEMVKLGHLLSKCESKIYNTFLYYLARSNDNNVFWWALLWLKEMKEKNIKVTYVTYRPLLDSLIRTKQFDKSNLLLTKMREEGISDERRSSDYMNYVMKYAAREGDVETLQKKWEVLSSLVPNSFAYAVKIQGFSKARQFDEVLKIYQAALASEIEVNTIVFINMMDACAMADGDHTDMIEKIFQDMKDRNVKMDQNVYITAIEAYTRHGHIDQALQIFTDMKNKHLGLNVKVCRNFLSLIPSTWVLQLIRGDKISKNRKSLISIFGKMPEEHLLTKNEVTQFNLFLKMVTSEKDSKFIVIK